MSAAEQLLQLEPFQTRFTPIASPEEVKNAYDRARLLCRHYRAPGLTVDDIKNLTPRFWSFHLENILSGSGAAMTLITIHYNLVMGTLAGYVDKQPNLQPLLDRLARFDIVGQFMLTEIGHGLDAANLETTATLQADGSYELHTPNKQAAKYMPPSTPESGVPAGAVVFARLVISGEDRGVRPFWTMINNGSQMEDGVTSIKLPRRAASQAVAHAITIFNRKRLPASALLGSHEKPQAAREHFLSLLHRVTVGSLALSMIYVPQLRLSTYIVAKYSQRRTVTGPDGQPMPIMAFRTQQRPILHALAQAVVFEAGAKHCAALFAAAADDPRVQHGIAAAFKAGVTAMAQESLVQLADRCGARGLFEHNHVVRTQMEMRGNSIAEGDVLALSIRLTSELLLARYALPPTPHPSALPSLYSAGLLASAAAIASSIAAENPSPSVPHHRTPLFSTAILPLALPLVSALGWRLVFDGALARAVDPDLLDLFEAGVAARGAGWCVENRVRGWASGREIREREGRALDRCLARVGELLDGEGGLGAGVGEYVRGGRVPMLEGEGWEGWEGLPRWEGRRRGGAKL